jgi:PIN domain nuclease of toxin-antitoxin system
VSVLDASAVLAWAQGEPGSDVVEQVLLDGAVCGAANWSEVVQKVRAAGKDWTLLKALLENYAVTVEPVTAADAELAAEYWRPGSGLSLGDRLCLALAERRDATAWTADTAWGTSGRVRQIR